MTSEQAAVQTQTPLTLFKYSNRVILKTILGRSDGGIGLVGERVVIGGWVKSSKELRKEPPAPAGPRSGGDAQGQGDSNISCVEIIQSRIPFFRSIMKVLGGAHFPVREKPDFAIQKPQQPPPPSTAILHISDGSCVSYLQALVDSSIAPPIQILPTGTCVLVEGVLQQPATQGKHAIELKVDRVMHIGMVNQDRYPLSKKRLPLEMFRDFPHFRPRTTTVASVSRIRDSLHQAIQTFFMKNGFLYVQVPIITTTDGEGFSEKFQVTTLLGSKGVKEEEPFVTVDTRGAKPETIEPSIKEESKQLENLERTESNWDKLIAALEDLREKNNQQAAQLEAIQKSKSPTSVKTDTVDFSEDFFSCQTFLTVSGRLHLESYARALGNVYSFGPRFRAHKMESKTQVAEMWMIELEMAFSQLQDAMDCADDFLMFTSKWVLENCLEDLKFLSKRVDQTIVNRLQSMTSNLFPRISYAEALEVLKQAKDKKFTANIEWGMSLTEEHKSYLANEFYRRPFIIHNYPKELKPFYVRLNSDGKTVASFDLVVPKAGTLIRGSQNEERLDVLTTRIKELGLQKGQYEWYLDLRMHGTVTSCGFSLAFDLLALCATGLIDVRDVIPFPRSRGKANL